MPRSAAAVASDPPPERALEIARYRDNWVRHLLAIAEDLSQRVIDRLERECGYEKIRPSLGPFISLVWREPRPMTELAQQLSISRQACSKVARQAEESGYVERIEGRDGDRAQRVRLTERGQKLVEDSVRLLLEAETSYADWIGDEGLQRLNLASSSLFFGLGLQDQTDAGLGEAARRSIGVLPMIATRVEEELREATRAKGHAELQISHARVIALLGDDEKSVSEIARLQGVSRQASGATVHRLEALGYVRRDSHETDGRALRVRLDQRGGELIRDTLAALTELEERFREILGRRRFEDLVSISAELHGVLDVESALDEAGIPETREGGPVSLSIRAAEERELRAIAARLSQRLGESAAARLASILSEEGAARRA